MPSTPPDIGQPTREARNGHEDRGQRGNKWWTLVAVCLGTLMLLLDITIVNVALPDIQRALHSSFADLQWVVDAYALTLAAFLLTAGSLADMFGRRLMYLTGLAIFTVASVLCGFAASAVQSGEIGHLIAKLPPPLRPKAGEITRAAFTTGLNHILLVAAIIALVSALVSLVAIRTRDFAPAAPGGQEGPRK